MESFKELEEGKTPGPVVVWAQEVYKFHLDENQVDGNDAREQNGSGLASLPSLHSSFIIKFNKIIKLD